MKIVRYVTHNPPGGVHNGVVKDGNVFELEGDILSGNTHAGKMVGSIEDLRLVSPCQPAKIICVAINFPGILHFSPTMSEPLVFVKPPSCICGPGDTVENPFPGLSWWGEAELAVVIGKRLRNISDCEAREGILGFTIANDTTVENVDHRDHHLARSKCADKFCAVGPWIDTEFDASDCVIEAIQNGEVIRRGRSSDQFWQWQRIISWLSTWMTLNPWDLVLTGNPPDTVGMRFLGDDDIYTARVSGLGELTNRFVRTLPIRRSF
ncbi:Fumarylacetoacetate (FAA) hydrolase [Raphidiopsis brookii D9]|nr:Fumarylacetoacetate (FAA) hydrolase [Raphidiopsis brookii D9]